MMRATQLIESNSLNNFETMELFAPLNKALAEQNYETPTPIQLQTIPPAVDGQDILGCAQTGTGKTAAFALPILDFLGHEEPKVVPNRPSALILAPTRELAIQISDSLSVYGKHMRFSQALVFGGVSQNPQVKALNKGVDIVVATPGRLMDLMQQGYLDLRNIQIFVLDEADRMLDMGFMPVLKKIIAKLPKQRQSMFFSATVPPKTRELANQLLFNPVQIDVTPEHKSVKKIKQTIWLLSKRTKVSGLLKLLSDKAVEQTIVFTRTKRGANQVVKNLVAEGVNASAIHGNKSQNARQRALEAFRQKKIRVLVATDVAARGIDIDDVSHVVNFDMPIEAESYVHRIGRTGRAGKTGIAISFCTPDEKEELKAIEKLIGKRIHSEEPKGLKSSGGTVSTPSRRRYGRTAKSKKMGGTNPRTVNSTRSNASNSSTSSFSSKSERNPRNRRLKRKGSTARKRR